MGYLKFGLFFMKNALFRLRFPLGASFDITNRCNLKCKHCYFWQQNHKSELSDKEFLKKIKDIKKKYPNITNVCYIGGEPLLRKDLIAECLKFFPFNMVITNGTIELPKWKNCVFNVSVDGTKKTYEKIRGKNLYDKVKKNANRDDIRVNVAFVITKINYKDVEAFVKEWKKTKVNGVMFDFYTPIKGIKEDLWLDWRRRDKVIDKIIELKKTYGSFIINSKEILRLMKSENAPKTTTSCILPKAVMFLDPMGKKKRCAMDLKADCSRCGCLMPFLLEALVNRKSLGSFITSKKLFT